MLAEGERSELASAFVSLRFGGVGFGLGLGVEVVGPEKVREFEFEGARAGVEVTTADSEIVRVRRGETERALGPAVGWSLSLTSSMNAVHQMYKRKHFKLEVTKFRLTRAIILARRFARRLRRRRGCYGIPLHR